LTGAPTRLLVSEGGCREAPTGHARWSHAVVGDPVASQVNSDADPMMWFGAAEGHRFEFHKWPANEPLSDVLSLPAGRRYPMATRRCKRTNRLRPQKSLQIHAFSRAAEGIRTLDLLHGKQNMLSPLGPEIPCKHGVLGWDDHSAIPRLSPRDHGGLGTQWAPNYSADAPPSCAAHA
jgi:hypothetical protein